jgi:formylglycine-generating enzyme required for sulfatase activity
VPEKFIPGISHVAGEAEAGGHRAQASVEITRLFRPADWAASEGETVEDSNKSPYYVWLERRLPDGGAPVRFLLIPKRRKEDPETFYMMRDKVSVGQFGAFSRARPGDVKGGKWNKGELEDYPVWVVTVEDAHRFAQWLGGRLPSTEQWDKAAGAYEDNRGEGPYVGSWAAAAKPDIAVGREAPKEVGTARDDHSPFGCRDMAGNGLEWTRTVNHFLLKENRTVPVADPGPDDQVALRGRDFSDDEPFRYEHLITRGRTGKGDYIPPLVNPTKAGFRVVIEP